MCDATQFTCDEHVKDMCVTTVFLHVKDMCVTTVFLHVKDMRVTTVFSIHSIFHNTVVTHMSVTCSFKCDETPGYVGRASLVCVT